MSCTHRASYIGVFTGAYSLARKIGLLRLSWFRAAFISTYFLYKRIYEDPFLRLTKRMPGLFHNGDILDIGANLGYTSFLFSCALKSASKVYAFEPDQFSYGLLQQVIRRKKLLCEIEAVNCAIGSSEGAVEFWHNVRHSADHRVVTETFRSVHADCMKVVTVPLTSIDAFVRTRSLHSISFIKIDVQGYELAVCEGMKDTLERFPGLCVCFEYSPQCLLELGFEPAKLLNFFRARGYYLYIVTRDEIQPAPDNRSIQRYAAAAGYVDVLCSREGALPN